MQFLADDPSLRTEFRAKSALAYVAGYSGIRDAMRKLAEKEGAELRTPRGGINVHVVDEQGMEVSLGKETLRAKALLLAGELPDEPSRMLALPEGWSQETLRQLAFVRLKASRFAEIGARPIVSMSLDLSGKLTWAWMLPAKEDVQLVVEQHKSGSEEVGARKGAELLAHWASVLHGHGVLKTADLPTAEIKSMDVPLAGALEREGVANRTLLIGPAGGFFSATGEDIYPNCWSAVFAAETVKKALKEPHLQDALQPYRQRWGATLGDYLRGPQQNLRFLMPLVYRNPVMTTRLSESILLGKQVVR
jgi:flavin-dependent dehydrogenase